MIRRDLPADAGGPARWVFINQIDHAHLSFCLAEHWGAAGFAPLVPRTELLWAIDHHDDGWRAWDAAPDVDPARSVPRSFLEMEVDDSLAIWSRSIAGAAQAGALQGYLVAGHFCVLARHAASKSTPEGRRAATFIADYEEQRRTWLADWQRQDPTANTTALAERGLAQLQLFDMLSLWFCCADETEPATVTTPGGVELTLTPLVPGQVGLAPWPLALERLNLEIPGRIVPADRYESRAALAAAASQPIRLCWEVRPGGGENV